MTTPPALAVRPPSPLDPAEELSLTALLEFFAAEEPVSARTALREHAVRLLDAVRTSSRRAAAWGAVPVLAGTETVEVP